MKRCLTMLLICCIAIMPLSGMALTVGATTQTTYAVDALSFTAGYASSTDGTIDLSAVKTYDAHDTHDLQYTDDYTELSSASGIPYQIFDVDLAGNTTGQVAVHYSGSTKAGERIALKAYNVQTAAWDTIGTFKGTGTVSASIDAATYNDNGTAHVAAMLDYVTNGADTMIWSTDPQHYTEFADLNEYYYTVYQYAAEEYQAGNVGYILTTGDLVDDRPYSSKAKHQWQVSDRAMSYIEAVGMPNGLVAGNHDVGDFSATDYSNGNADVDYSMFAKTFPASRYENERWYGGSLNNNTSHYDLITIGNVDFVILFLGYGVEATDETIAWANNVLKTYSHRTGIVATHQYLEAVDAYYKNRGKLIFDSIVDPNPNVKLVLCGHDDGSVCRKVKASDGRTVYEMLADYQFVEAESPDFYANEHYIGNVSGCCGDGYIRRLTVKGDTLSSITYSPVTGRYNPYGDVENITIDLDCGTPDRSMATARFSAAVLNGTTDTADVDRMTVTSDDNGTSYSAVTYASVPSAPAATDTTAWPSASYGVAATPSNPYYAHAAKEAPNVKFKVDLLDATNIGEHPIVNGNYHIGDYSLNLEVDLNLTPYLYYSFAQPSDSKFTFATINDTTAAPWITFLDTRKGGTTLNYGSDAWDTAGGAQYFTGSVTGCIDMRTMVSVAGATDWTVEQLNLYSANNKDVVISYLFFGSEPLDLIGNTYGEPATTAVPYAQNASANAPKVAHKANLLHAVNLNENAIIWDTVNYGNQSLGYEVDLNKTPYLYYSFAQSDNSRFTFSLMSENSNVPWLTFLDTRLGGATLNKSDANWNAAGSDQYFTDSATGCIDMRQFQYDKSVGRWRVEQVNFYNLNGTPVMVNYFFFGSAAIGGECADSAALDALVAKANATDTAGMTTASVNALRSARYAATVVDRNDAAAVAHAYANLEKALGGLVPEKVTEVSANGLVSVKKYSVNPDKWLCSGTLSALSSSKSYVTAETTSTGMRLRRSSASPHTYPSITDNDSYTVNPYGGVYLKLDATMNTAWTIALNVTQDGVDTRVRLNAGIVNSFHSETSDNYYGVFQNIYDVSDAFRMHGLDPTATFKVNSCGLTTVGAADGWNYYNHIELLTGASTSANYGELEDTMAYANQLTKSMYTSDSWSAFQSALSKAKTSMSTVGLSQPQINLSLHRLQTAIENLQYTSFAEPSGSLLANDLGEWRTNGGKVTVTRTDGNNVFKNTDGSWAPAEYRFTAGRRVTVADHQLELNMSVQDATNIILLVDGEWISITKYLTANRNGEDILAGDYRLKVPLTTIFGDKVSVVIEGSRIWSVGAIGNNAVTIERFAIDDLDTATFDNSLNYGIAAMPSSPFHNHAAKNGPIVAQKVDVLAACGLHQPTLNSYQAFGQQDLKLKVDIAKTPYLYYSIAQAPSAKASFGFHSDNTNAPFFCFLDVNRGGSTLNTGTDTWEAYSNHDQYIVGSVTGCIDMRTLLKDPANTEWCINNVSLYTTSGSPTTFSYLYFGSEPLSDGFEEEPVLMGDVNGDGKVTTLDARILMLEVLSNRGSLSALQIQASEMSGDGKLSTSDVRLIVLKALTT